MKPEIVYNTPWILQDLSNTRIKSHHPYGELQSRNLSVILFLIKINDNVEDMNPGTDNSLFVDFTVCYAGKNIVQIEHQLH